MNPEGIMLRDISQTEKHIYCIVLLIIEILKKKKKKKPNS